MEEQILDCVKIEYDENGEASNYDYFIHHVKEETASTIKEEHDYIKHESIDIKEDVDEFYNISQESLPQHSVFNALLNDGSEIDSLSIKEEPDVLIKEEIDLDIKEESLEYDNTDDNLEKIQSYSDNLTEENSLKFILYTNKNNKLVYECVKCKYQSDRRYRIHRHVLIHSEVVTCDLCEFRTSVPASMKAHKISKHNIETNDDIPVFKCGKCNYCTIRKVDLKKHETIHKSDKIKCDLCPYETLTQQSLHVHNILKHGMENDLNITVYKCDRCSYSTIERHNLLRHELVHKKNIKCDLCKYESATNARMKAHKISKHNIETSDGIPVYKCNLCNYCSYRKEYLKNHSVLHKSEKIKCDLCEYDTTTNKNLSRHKILKHGMRNDSNKPVYKCNLCKFSTFNSSDLTRHKYIHEGDKIKCDLCDFRTTPDYLKVHQLSKHNIKSENVIKCDQCSYFTYKKSCLKRHQVIHQADTFNCDLCDYGTKKQENLKIHKILKHGMENDLNKTIYKCEVCGYASFNKTDVIKHKLIHVEEKLKCDSCEYEAAEEEALKMHKILKHGMENDLNKIVYKCEQCSYSTFRACEMKKHHLVHLKDKVKCNLCEFSTATEESLRVHKLSRHKVLTAGEGLVLKCSQCTYFTYNKHYMKRHLLLHQSTRIKCDLCDYETPWRNSIKLHYKKKHGIC